MCRFWEKDGICEKGNTCQFVHSFSVQQKNDVADRDDYVSNTVVRSSNDKEQPNTKTTAKECRFWKRGNCKLGERCEHLHLPREVESAPINKQLTPPLPATTATTNTTLCRFWKKTGECKNGDGCKFAHSTSIQNEPASPVPLNDVGGHVGDQEKSKKRTRKGKQTNNITPPSPQPPLATPSAPLAAAVAEYTPAGPVISHTVPPVTKVCHYWKRGSCKNGASCKFLHPNTSVNDVANAAKTGAGAEVRADEKQSVEDTSLNKSGQDQVDKNSKKKEKRANKNHNIKLSSEEHELPPSSNQPPQQEQQQKQSFSIEVEACRFFARNGQCRKGDKCAYSHSTTTTVGGADIVVEKCHARIGNGCRDIMLLSHICFLFSPHFYFILYIPSETCAC
jgi:hypothetical protein